MKNRKNFGFVILFGFTATSLEGQKKSPLTDEELEIIHSTIEELLHPMNYNDDILQCPDTQIMVNPERAFEIFCDFYDENETYIVENLLINQTK